MADRNGFETEHLWVEERLSAYVDNQLAPLERAQLERHLRDCARCQASLTSLRWAVALLKQAPAPAVPRQFTLPLPAQTRRAPAYGFAFARFATVVATLLLFAVFGIDMISRLGGGFSASAPAPVALREAVQPTSVALAPTEPVSAAQPAAPTAAPAPAFAPTAARPPTLAAPPAPAALPPSAPTEITGLGGAPAETSAADNMAKSAAATSTTARVQAPARAPAGSATPAATSLAAGAVSVPTATSVPATVTPPPTATVTAVPPTATPPPPSPTPAVQALVQPTVASLPPRQVETAAPVVEPLRVAEIGLFFFVMFFGALTIMLRRR